MNEEICGKGFRKYVESLAIIIFFRLFPDEVHNILFCGVRGCDGNLLTRTYSRTNIVNDYVMLWSFQPSDFVEKLHRLLG